MQGHSAGFGGQAGWPPPKPDLQKRNDLSAWVAGGVEYRVNCNCAVFTQPVASKVRVAGAKFTSVENQSSLVSALRADLRAQPA